VYIADTGNNALKEWNVTTHTVSTLVSSGLNGPAGVAVDGSGDVYIADTGNNALKEWNVTTHTVSTLVSSGLNGPTGVAVDAAGNVCFSDSNHGNVDALPRAFVDPTPRVESAGSGSDSLPVVLPTTLNLQPPFAPQSDQSWLGISSVAGGQVTFTFTDNTSGHDRSANVSLLGTNIPVIQAGGSGPGTISSSSATWGLDGEFAFEIDEANTATGIPGGEPGWSLLDVSGTLAVTATAADPFTIVLATFSSKTMPGSVPDFFYTNKGAGYYSWKIATASSISGFDPTKVAVNASQFANFLGGGTFSVSEAASGEELDLTYEPYACAASDMPSPGYELTNYPAGSPPFTFVGVYLFYTNAHGLGGIQGTKTVNCTMPYAWAYGPGLPTAGTSIGAVAVDPVNYTLLPIGTTNLTILAAKTTLGQDSVVNASAWDSCFDFQANFDPEVAIVTAGPNVQAQQVYAGLDSAEHYVTILNGNPGLTALRLLVNGWTYNLGAVGQGQTVMVNVGASFKPGSTNTVALLGEGPSGAMADVVISDQPDGSMLAVTPTVQPPLLSVVQQQGKIMVQWLAPANSFTLQGRQSLSPQAPWQDSSSGQQESQGWSSVTLPVNTGPQFFRLRK